MTKLSTTSRSVFLFLVAALPLFSCGCRFEPKDVRGPAIRGHWRGRVAPMTVYDRFGRTYTAAALEVHRGPKGYATPARTGGQSFVEHVNQMLGSAFSGGRLPLLVEREANHPILPAANAPLGEVVGVRGTMRRAIAAGPRTRETPNGGWTVSRVRHQGDPRESDQRMEQVLLLEGNLKQVNED